MRQYFYLLLRCNAFYKADKLLQLADHEKGARDRFSSGRFRGLQVKKPWVNPLVLQGLFCTVGLTASILKNKLSK